MYSTKNHFGYDSPMMRQFTASVYILDQGKVLLIYHKKLQKWLQPGGHIDPGELPSEAAVREALEETGMVVEIIPQENVWIQESNARSFPRPFVCELQEIPAYKEQPAHQHIDFQYLARPVGGGENQNLSEIEAMRWFTLEEVEALKPGVEVYKETQEVLRTILSMEILI